MATVKELITRFGFEVDDKGLKDLDEGISAVKDGILGLGATIVGAGLTLFGFVETAAHAGNELHRMTQTTGIAVENLQRLQFVAKLADVSSEELGQSLNFLNRNMNEARTGSAEARKNFRNLGISVEQLKDPAFTADKALAIVGKRFEKMPNGPQKTAMAMELFGRGGARMVTVLNEISQGLTPVQEKVLAMSMITEEQTRQGDEFGDALDVLLIAWKSIAKTIGFELMPVVKDIVDQMTLWIVENKELVKTNIKGFVKGLTSALKAAIRIADILIQSFSGLAHGIGGVEIMTKLLVGGFALLSGASILFGIGKIANAVVMLSNAFKIAGLSAALMQVAIGAAFIAIFLVAEDIYSFFNGKDSFLGDILDKLPELGTAFKSIFEPIFEPFVNIVTMLTDGFSSWKDIFAELGKLIVNAMLLPLRAVASTVGGIAGAVGRFTGSETLKGIGDSAAGLGQDLTFDGIAKTFGNPTGIGPQAAVAGAQGTGLNQSLKVDQQFVFPPGTDPETAGPKVSSAVSDGLDEVLRKTQRSTSNGGAY